MVWEHVTFAREYLYLSSETPCLWAVSYLVAKILKLGTFQSDMHPMVSLKPEQGIHLPVIDFCYSAKGKPVPISEKREGMIEISARDGRRSSLSLLGHLEHRIDE